jgi:hypothetical protein
LDPPGVVTRGFAEPAHRHADRCSQCGHATDPRKNTRFQIAKVRRSQGPPMPPPIAI